MTEEHKSPADPGLTDRQPEQFISRDRVEQEIMFPVGQEVVLEGHWRGAKHIECKRWNTRKAIAGGKLVSDILAALFPDDALFLLQIQWGKPATASSQLYDIVFNRIYDPMVKLVCLTLDIVTHMPGTDGNSYSDDVREFIETTTPTDIMELFVCIVNQEINSSNVEAIIKKAQRLLVEKFQLDNDSLSLQNILGALLQTPLTGLPPTNSPS
jgi:hypothetical protein